ncbi:MAG: tetratricopeptide repeat protein [Candidatus Scalindua sp.]
MQQIIKKYYTKLLTRPVIIIVMIAVILHLDCNINSVHAATEKQVLEKAVNSRENNLEESGKSEIPAASSSTENQSIEKRVVYHFNLGAYYQKQGNITRAVKEYETVLGLDPNNAEALNNLGVIYREQNDLDKAAEHYQLVVSLNPGMEEAHNNLGVIYYLRSNYREAGLEFRKALEINPDNLKSVINIGLVYKTQGLIKKAIETLEGVLTEDNFQPEAHYNLAILYEEMGHLEMALWHYTRFIDNADRDYSALIETVSEHIKDLQRFSGDSLRE